MLEMAIPEITRTNVLAALVEIDRSGVPKSRASRRYLLVHEGLFYPPKYVISLAVRHATGTELDPENFSGGVESNSLLKQLGFSIVAPTKNNTDVPTVVEETNEFSDSTEVTQENSEHWYDSVEHGPTLIGRLVVCGEPGDPSLGEFMLLQALAEPWPEGLHFKFFITPGGFVSVPLPSNWAGGSGWSSNSKDMETLRGLAEVALRSTITDRVLEAAQGKLDVLTIGIDLYGDGIPTHAELVAVYEIASNRVFWTGKSYPTMRQEHDLIQIVDLDTHFLEIAGERVLVLGCHDLNVYSARVHKNFREGSIRWQRCTEMLERTKQFEPTIVLQHPHSTDTPRIWNTAWSGVRSNFPKLKAWASGIAYFSWNGEPRADLDDVLMATQGGVEEAYDILLGDR